MPVTPLPTITTEGGSGLENRFEDVIKQTEVQAGVIPSEGGAEELGLPAGGTFSPDQLELGEGELEPDAPPLGQVNLQTQIAESQG